MPTQLLLDRQIFQTSKQLLCHKLAPKIDQSLPLSLNQSGSQSPIGVRQLDRFAYNRRPFIIQQPTRLA